MEVTLSPGSLVVTNQSVGHAIATEGMDGRMEGILGLGPKDLTDGTTTPNQGALATVVDNLYAEVSPV